VARFIELTIDVPAAAVEVVASAISEVTGGVEIRDPGTMLSAGEGRGAIVTQCPPELEPAVLAELEATVGPLRAAGVVVDPMQVLRREADEEEWRDVWKQYFRALRVGRTFLIRPSWDVVPAQPGDRVIDIDPGRAFGTGGHASTRLVIAAAEEIADRPVRRFLDLGCGSGILSVAAARLWPEARGLAVDVDPEAVATTDENLARNGIRTVDTLVGDLAGVRPPFHLVDLILANIEASVLRPLAPELTAAVAPGGVAILSGLLDTDLESVIAAYRSAGLELAGRSGEGEWGALRMRRPG
jgi:ribosomal protein L11 methyltransferase